MSRTGTLELHMGYNVSQSGAALELTSQPHQQRNISMLRDVVKDCIIQTLSEHLSFNDMFICLNWSVV